MCKFDTFATWGIEMSCIVDEICLRTSTVNLDALSTPKSTTWLQPLLQFASATHTYIRVHKFWCTTLPSIMSAYTSRSRDSALSLAKPATTTAPSFCARLASFSKRLRYHPHAYTRVHISGVYHTPILYPETLLSDWRHCLLHDESVSGFVNE